MQELFRLGFLISIFTPAHEVSNTCLRTAISEIPTHISAVPPFDKYSPEVYHPFDLTPGTPCFAIRILMCLANGYQSRNSDLIIINSLESLPDFHPSHEEGVERSGAGGGSKGDESWGRLLCLAKLTWAVGRWNSNLALPSKTQTRPWDTIWSCRQWTEDWCCFRPAGCSSLLNNL